MKDNLRDEKEIKEMEELSDEEYEKRRQMRKRRMALRRKRQQRRRRIQIAVIVIAAAVIATGGIYAGIRAKGKTEGQKNNTAQAENTQKKSGKNVKAENTDSEKEKDKLEEAGISGGTLQKAEILAAQYDYDKAIELLKQDPDYEKNEDMKQAVKKFEEIKATCVSWPLEEVTHVFYHTMIVDTEKAFDGDYKEADYNQVMTTIDEFNKITQEMYDRGYVMVSVYDMAKVDKNGNMTPGEILLPPGKKPFVLSQDDVSYYHYMEGDGYPSKLIVDKEGKVRNEYVKDDGSISVGDYDMVPLIDRFVEKHPDFSYRGAKGIVALTGYNGILGYRTDISYETRPDDLDADKVKWLDEHPDFSLEKEREEAKKVAKAMKDNGWLFASHTYMGTPECRNSSSRKTSGRYAKI